MKTETEKRELYLRQREEDTVEAKECEQNRPNIGFPHYVELIDPTFRDVGGVD